MKPSHFVTPRTLDEATFYTGGAPIEKPLPSPVHLADKVLYALAVVSVVLVGYLLATGA